MITVICDPQHALQAEITALTAKCLEAGFALTLSSTPIPADVVVDLRHSATRSSLLTLLVNGLIAKVSNHDLNVNAERTK